MMKTLKKQEQAVFALRRLYRDHGYTSYQMSRFEAYELYARNKDFLVSDQIITFSDRGGRLLALKPDVTLSIVKNAPQEPCVVQKVYYNENIYRDFREILQAGLECVGDLGDYEIAEVVLLAVRSLALLGKRFVLDISHVGLIGAVFHSCGLSSGDRGKAMDCLRRKNLHELEQLCGERDLSWEKLCCLATCRGGGEAVLPQLRSVLTTASECQALEELENLWTILKSAGWEEYVRFDFSVGNDMRYYSGVVFKGYLAGIPTGILSGGQYDRLPQKLGRRARAIGFAINLDLLENEDPEQAVDTLILHDGSIGADRLMTMAQKAEKEGSVLVTRQMPKGRGWKRIIRVEKGVVRHG